MEEGKIGEGEQNIMFHNENWVYIDMIVQHKCKGSRNKEIKRRCMVIK